ncbi:hypothetical protein [Beduini massiliensis]|uniref:hypothetical protein n=1 Tax=Beduini massiliensis TaxID=1585974 RepID=UPI00059A9A7A|nr:hypothetical protein [Beduini massiliensis]
MTYQEKVNYLKSYKDKYYRWIFLNNQIEGVKAISYKDDISGPRKSINDYIEEKTCIECDLNEIEGIIDEIRDDRLKYVLKYKFIQFKSLEEIADIMRYSLPWIKKLYKKAINCIP